MQIVVKSKEEAAELLKKNPDEFSFLLSIHSPGNTAFTEFDSEPVNGFDSFSNPKLELIFDDIENENVERMGLRGPKEHHIKELLEWLDGLNYNDVDKLLIHCAAGVARSTACAMICYYHKGHSLSESLEFVIADRPQAWPNMLVLECADKVLGLEGKMVQTVSDWKVTCRYKDMK